MSNLIVDKDLQAKLNGLNEQIELHSEGGQVVGYFLPAALYKEMLLAWADRQISAEELARRRCEPRGRTLEQIWKSLGQA